MRLAIASVLLAGACSGPSYDFPDAHPLEASCLELSNLATRGADAVCHAGDTIVIGDELSISGDAKTDATITCEGVPCSTDGDVVPLAAGELTVHVALQSTVNADHDDVTLPTLHVVPLDRIDITCGGCTGATTGAAITVSAVAYLDGAPRDLHYSKVDEHVTSPFPPAGAYDGTTFTWTWTNAQPGTYTVTIGAGGRSASLTATVTP